MPNEPLDSPGFLGDWIGKFETPAWSRLSTRLLYVVAAIVASSIFTIGYRNGRFLLAPFVAVALIVGCIFLLLPAVQQNREAARRSAARQADEAGRNWNVLNAAASVRSGTGHEGRCWG